MGRPSLFVNDQDIEAMGFGVEGIRGLWDGLSVPQSGTAVYGRLGQIAPAGDPGASPRTIEITGLIRGTSNADLRAKSASLKALFSRGVLELRRSDDPSVVCDARALALTIAPYGPALIATSADITVTLFSDDPLSYDAIPRVVAFATTPRQMPLGNAPSVGIVRISPDPGGSGSPKITYRDITGAIRETIQVVHAFSVGFIDIDLGLSKVTKSDGTDLTGAIDPSGNFFALSPLDGDPLSSTWPTLELSVASGVVGSATLLYRKAWQ